jgi:hypothetical protein
VQQARLNEIDVPRKEGGIESPESLRYCRSQAASLTEYGLELKEASAQLGKALAWLRQPLRYSERMSVSMIASFIASDRAGRLGWALPLLVSNSDHLI